jgi:hypothetical protein
VTAVATAGARGADTPAMCAALDVLACLPADNGHDDKFADVGGGGGGRGRWPGDRQRDDHRSAIRPCCDMSGTALRHGWKWNGLNFKRLGKVKVISFENICAIVVPVDLSCYVFGRRCVGFVASCEVRVLSRKITTHTICVTYARPILSDYRTWTKTVQISNLDNFHPSY